MLMSARKDEQRVTADWSTVQPIIDGVVVREVRHVPRDHGVITEMYRPEWDPTGLPVVHIYQSRLFPGALGAWSCHQKSIDRLFVSSGQLKIVLYDGRAASPTASLINELHVGDSRPAMVVIPPGVWHGVQNLAGGDACLLNFPTVGYVYEDPDHFRLPFDSPEIPYDWRTAQGSTRLRGDPPRR